MTYMREMHDDEFVIKQKEYSILTDKALKYELIVDMIDRWVHGKTGDFEFKGEKE